LSIYLLSINSSEKDNRGPENHEGRVLKTTRRLIRLVADRRARPVKRTKRLAGDADRALLDLLLAAARLDDSDGSVGVIFACQILDALGLLGQDASGSWIPTPLLAQLVVEASEMENCDRP
jgi:hypothetical protein